MHDYRQNDGLPPGWFDPVEVDAYRRLIGRVSQGVVGEVGVANGRSFCSVSDLCRQQELSQIAVDVAIPVSFLTEIRGRGIHAVMIQNSSLVVAEGFNKRSLAGVFIDADHTYEAVRGDLTAWWPLVRPGGFLAGHDYGEYRQDIKTYEYVLHPENPGVMGAVRHILGEPHLVAGTVWGFWKD